MKGSRPLTSAEVLLLREKAEDPRLRALVSVLCYTGARLSEALALTWGDVLERETWELKATITLRRAITKGQREGRIVPTHPQLREELQRYRLRGDGSLVYNAAPLFTWSRSAASRAFERHTRACGLVGVSSHGCRKWLATELLGRGARMNDVRALLGHADLRTTAAYIGGPTPEQLRETVSRLPGDP